MGIQLFSEMKGPGYSFRDKLSAHVLERSAAAFDAGDARRRAIDSPAALQAYADEMRSRFIDAAGGIPYDPALPLCAEMTGTIPGPVFDIEKVIWNAEKSTKKILEMF